MYIGKKKVMLGEILQPASIDYVNPAEAMPAVCWVEESGRYMLPLTITWDGSKQ